MTNEERPALKTLRSLYRIVEAGERGFATAATNLQNRGSKLLFKSYAQQRARFKAEILTELERLANPSPPGSNILGMIHRGRVAIFSAMTIDREQREKVVLKEAALGEKYAVQAYQKASSANLPTKIHEMIELQFEDVRQTVEDIHRLLGRDGKTMVVQLYDTEKSADDAVHSLETAGFPAVEVEKVAVNPSIDLYEGKGITVFETILSGIVGGVVWGSLIGFLAGFGAVQSSTAAWSDINAAIGLWAIVGFATIMLAAFLGGVLGMFIGAGISQDDRHVYQNSAVHGRFLVKVFADSDRKQEARDILNQEGLSPSYASG